MDEHIHIHIHHGQGRDHGPGEHWRGRRGPGRGRWGGRDLDEVVSFLERRQRDLEQAAADVADKIRRLKERAATSPAPAEGEGAPPA